jgi:hypothetical protein
MSEDIMSDETVRMQTLKQNLFAVIQGTLAETLTAYNAIPEDPDLQEARAQVAQDGGMLTTMQEAICREIDAQIVRLREKMSMFADRNDIHFLMDDMSIGGGAWNRDAARNDQIGAARNDQNALDAARNDQIARDAQFAAELAGDAGDAGVLQEGGECPICLSVPPQCVLPCGHRICFDCIASLVAATPVVDGEQHVPCPICRVPFSNEADVHPLHDFHGRMYAQLPKQGMLAMQRLLLKL